MGVVNGGVVLILIAIAVVIAFGKEITDWVDGTPPATPLPCDVCGGMTPVDGASVAPVLCAACARVAAAGGGQ